MHILFVTSAHNSLSQRLYIELTELGHAVSVALATSEQVMLDAVETTRPDFIIAPILDLYAAAPSGAGHGLAAHPGLRAGWHT